MNATIPKRLPRREAIKWVLAASATVSLLDWRGFGAPSVMAKGYGTDPDLLETYNAGDLWPLTLSEAHRRTATALGDVIIPADDKSPAASGLQVVDFIDEWISAPYPEQQHHREIIVNGLTWIEAESAKRFKKSFADLSKTQQQAICDDICFAPKAAPEFRKAATFFFGLTQFDRGRVLHHYRRVERHRLRWQRGAAAIRRAAARSVEICRVDIKRARIRCKARVQWSLIDQGLF